MNRNSLQRLSGSSAIGWISTADTLLFGLVFLLIVSLFLDGRLQKTTDEFARKQREYEQEIMVASTARDDALQEVEEKTKQLAELSKERNRLVADLEMEHKEAARLAQSIRELESERDTLIAKSRDLGNKIAAFQTKVVTLDEKIRGQADELKAERHARGIAEKKAEGSQREIEKRDERIAELKKMGPELIGLKGKMHRVVILFDSSESMKNGGRWESTRSVVNTWLKFLSVDECALVVFGSDIEFFPKDRPFLDMRGEAGDQNRESLIKFLAAREPRGGTDTLTALKLAYKYPGVDTIVLLTDGAPNNKSSPAKAASIFDPKTGFDRDCAEAIYAECARHKDIPINVVGLGDYFEPKLSKFLLRIKSETDGTFLGR